MSSHCHCPLALIIRRARRHKDVQLPQYEANLRMCGVIFFFFTYIPCVLILSKFFYSPTAVQVNGLKNNFKIYIKINIKTAPTYFGAVTPSSGSALLVLAKVTVVKIAN